MLPPPPSLLVGAPRELGSNGAITGAVYRCNLDNSSNDCSRLETFDRYDGEYQLRVCMYRAFKIIKYIHISILLSLEFCVLLDQEIAFDSGSPVIVSSHSDHISAIDGQLLGYSLDSINDFAIVRCHINVVGLLIRSCLLV